MIVPLTPLDFRLRAAQLYATKVGIIDGTRRFTYGEYDERVGRLAACLRESGLKPGDVVSYLCFNSHQLLEGYYGVLQAGCILNPVNIRLSPEDIAFVLGHSETRALIFHADFLPLVEHLRPRIPSIKHYICCESAHTPAWARDYEAALASVAAPDVADLDAVNENALAELFYTSGTTGLPKGVASTHRTLYLHGLSSLWSLQIADADVALHVVPLFHVNGWGTPHSVTACGARHVMLRKFDPVALMTLVQQERVTLLLGVPLIFNTILNHPQFGEFDLSSLRACLIGGAPASPALVRAMEDKLGCHAVVGYGLTETSPVLTVSWPKDNLLTSRDERLAYQAKTGLAQPGVRLRVVGLDGREVAHDGADMGEIIVRSNVVMDGYYKDPKSTAAAIRDGWFYTGDMAVVDPEGYVLIVDRRKDLIISGGENISSVEIEKVISAHPAVLECAVVPVPDEKWGEVPLAAVVVKPGQTLTEEDLLEFARANLAHFKVPRRVDFWDSLPRTGTGKVLKSRIKERYWQGSAKKVN